MLALLAIVASFPAPTLQQTGGVNSISARSYCYSVLDPILPTSCNNVRATSSESATRGLRIGDSTTTFMRLDYIPLNRNLSSSTNVSNASFAEQAFGTFFPKVDVYTVLTLNGTEGKCTPDPFPSKTVLKSQSCLSVLPYLDARKRSWEDITLNFELMHNATLHRAEPKPWFTYIVDTDSLYYIPYRGIIITLWNGLVSTIEWETVSKTFSFCPQDLGVELDSCPVLCNSTNFAGCNLKVGAADTCFMVDVF